MTCHCTRLWEPRDDSVAWKSKSQLPGSHLSFQNSDCNLVVYGPGIGAAGHVMWAAGVELEECNADTAELILQDHGNLVLCVPQPELEVGNMSWNNLPLARDTCSMPRILRASCHAPLLSLQGLKCIPHSVLSPKLEFAPYLSFNRGFL